jgi:hypothetical protein
VTNCTRQKLAYIYFEDDPKRRSATKLLSRDEALRVAGQICEAAGIGGRDFLGFYEGHPFDCCNYGDIGFA